jgi:hypothetical protein
MTERIHRLERQQWIPRPRDEVFAFFADAANLEVITPSFLHFRIVTPRALLVRVRADEVCDERQGCDDDFESHEMSAVTRA